MIVSFYAPIVNQNFQQVNKEVAKNNGKGKHTCRSPFTKAERRTRGRFVFCTVFLNTTFLTMQTW